MGNAIKEWIDRYIDAQQESLIRVCRYSIDDMITAITEVQERGNTLFVIGNGGSAANASHFAADLGPVSYLKTGGRFKVISLASNISSITAIANDACFDDIFKHQLRILARPGDALLVLTVSGCSRNIIRAVKFSRNNKLTTMAIYGSGHHHALEGMVEHGVRIPDTHYGRVEDLQMTVLHLIAYALMDIVVRASEESGVKWKVILGRDKI